MNKSIGVLAGCILLLLLPRPLYAATMLVHISFDGKYHEVTSTQVVERSFPARAARRPVENSLRYQVIDRQGDIIHSGYIDQPELLRGEYENAAGDHNDAHFLHQQQGNYWLRFPYDNSMQSLVIDRVLYTLPVTRDLATNQGYSGPSAIDDTRVLTERIASFRLPR